MSTILVVANETLAGAQLLETVKERASAGGEGTRVIVCVPRDKPKHGNIIYDDFVFDAAKVRIDLARRFLRDQGITAIGDVGDPDPYTATMDAVAEHHPRRDHRVDLPGNGLGLAAPRPDRAHPAGQRPAGHPRRPGHRRRGHPSTSRWSWRPRRRLVTLFWTR